MDNFPFAGRRTGFFKTGTINKKIYSLLNEKGIVYGIKQEVLFKH